MRVMIQSMVELVKCSHLFTCFLQNMNLVQVFPIDSKTCVMEFLTDPCHILKGGENKLMECILSVQHH